MTKINWRPALYGSTVDEVIVDLPDYRLSLVENLKFDLPVKGQKGYQLIYKPAGVIQAEGVNIVDGLMQAFAAQQVLDKIKSIPDFFDLGPEEKENVFVFPGSSDLN